MILTPTNQFGYSATISGGFTMANLSNNPYNIDYMKNRTNIMFDKRFRNVDDGLCN